MSKMVAPENPVPSHEEDLKYVKEDAAVIHDDIATAVGAISARCGGGL